MNWICSQIGAREHFAIPRALQSQQRLEKLYTDLKRPGLESIEPQRIQLFPFGGLKWWWKSRNPTSIYQHFTEHGEWFSKAVRRASRSFTPPDSVFFGYDTGFLEAAKHFQNSGAECVLGQMDPGRTEFDIVDEERSRWPGWETLHTPVPEDYHARREAEWEVADKIIVNSEWSRTALIQQGVSEDKILIIPLCFQPEVTSSPQPQHTGQNRPLEILWLGQVNLRKGIPYLIEAARELRDESVNIKIIGPLKINKDALRDLPENLEFCGPVPREEIHSAYRAADVFVLPTLSDGFAITQIEAMAYGLPVIATPNCGRVVTDNHDGFIIPVRDSSTLAEKIRVLANDRDKLSEFSANALEKSSQFTLDHLAKSLLAIDFG